MSRAAEHIDLTSALSLAAFGREVTGDAFARALNVEGFGMERAEALSRLKGALERLQRSVIAGDLALVGRHRVREGMGADAQTQAVPPIALHDYMAFDFSINGLRCGPPQILWFAVDESGFVQPSFARPDFYRDIQVARGQVRKFLGVGKSPALLAQTKPRLPDADLLDWFKNLTRDEQSLSQEALFTKAVEFHPTFKVTRERVRRLAGPRPRGRPKKSPPEKPAD